MSKQYVVKFDWVITQHGDVYVEADNEDDAIAKVEKMLRDKNAKDYEDPYLWLTEDNHPFFDVKNVVELQGNSNFDTTIIATSAAGSGIIKTNLKD